MGKKKAPGYDKVTVEMVRSGWPVKRPLLEIVNKSLTKGTFLGPWKIGLVKYSYK